MKIPIEHICALDSWRLDAPREKLVGAPFEAVQLARQTDWGLPFDVPLIGPRLARAGVVRAKNRAIMIRFFIIKIIFLINFYFFSCYSEHVYFFSWLGNNSWGSSFHFVRISFGVFR